MKNSLKAGAPITYKELEMLAFSTKTPNEQAQQYQGLLRFLCEYIPNAEYRQEVIDKYKQLRMLNDNRIIYSEAH